jgi:hypothetical protein
MCGFQLCGGFKEKIADTDTDQNKPSWLRQPHNNIKWVLITRLQISNYLHELMCIGIPSEFYMKLLKSFDVTKISVLTWCAGDFAWRS